MLNNLLKRRRVLKLSPLELCRKWNEYKTFIEKELHQFIELLCEGESLRIFEVIEVFGEPFCKGEMYLAGDRVEMRNDDELIYIETVKDLVEVLKKIKRA
jgi:hypothetical protein